MSLIGWIILFLVLNVVHFAGTWKLYKKAGFSPISALIPFYNVHILIKIINRPWWWIFLFFIPVVNNVMVIVSWVELAKNFGYKSTKDSILVIATLGFYLFYINYSDSSKYSNNKTTDNKTKEGDWVSAIIFAIVAATIIRTFTFEAYTIPTSSMEKSMMVGDFLFVSKISYGTRVPMTQFSLPLLHDSIPMLGLPAYLSSPQFPYFRLPEISSIKNKDIVVFNYPMVDAPVDKKTNYIKRCVAIAGDTLRVTHGQVSINGKDQVLPDGALPQFMYMVEVNKGESLNADILRDRLDITDPVMNDYRNSSIYYMNLTTEKVEKLKTFRSVKTVTQYESKPGEKDFKIFPINEDWNADNYGPIYIPKAGATVEINKTTLPLYKRLITVYEGNTLEEKADGIYINGVLTSSYIIKQDYYWMMGDNRHNSLDSRFWGFVPEDHIVGKPTFIWMSINQTKSGLEKFRWDRIMTGISDQGTKKSHKILVAILLLLGYGVNFFLKKRKKMK